MCGIVGAVSAERDISPILLEGLAALEYRGYDSAGMAVYDSGGGAVHWVRSVGKVVELEKLYRSELCTGRMGIAHTRWATHGKPSEANAHPQRAGDVLLVCNGIVENHVQLRKELQEKGHNFVSETDTESLAALIAASVADGDGSLRSALRTALSQVTGSYSLVVMTPGSDSLLAAVQGCPLVLGLGDGEMFLASDPLALARLTDQFVFFEDGDLVEVRADGYEVENGGKVVQRQPQKRHIPVSQLDKGNYRHFTEKEIAEQPRVVQEVLSGRLGSEGVIADSLGIPSERLQQIEQVHLVACGSAYFAAQIGSAWLEELAGVPARCWLGSEYRYSPVIVPKNTLFVAISQSGETADTLAALRRANELGYAEQLAICNVADSMMARMAPHVLLIRAGREVSVLSTKAVMAQIVSLLLLALDMARGKDKSSDRAAKICEELGNIPEYLREALALDESIELAANDMAANRNALFLGRGRQQQYIAAEGALKMKESAYIHAEAYAAGELKHGPLALVDEDMPVIALLPHEDKLMDKMLGNLEEVAARGGELLLIGGEAAMERVGTLQHHGILLPDAPPDTTLLMELVVVQLLAYHVARSCGTDVDQPRNLAKSVTVE